MYMDVYMAIERSMRSAAEGPVRAWPVLACAAAGQAPVLLMDGLCIDRVSAPPPSSQRLLSDAAQLLDCRDALLRPSALAPPPSNSPDRAGPHCRTAGSTAVLPHCRESGMGGPAAQRVGPATGVRGAPAAVREAAEEAEALARTLLTWAAPAVERNFRFVRGAGTGHRAQPVLRHLGTRTGRHGRTPLPLPAARARTRTLASPPAPAAADAPAPCPCALRRSAWPAWLRNERAERLAWLRGRLGVAVAGPLL
jgi:hypothetical protein